MDPIRFFDACLSVRGLDVSELVIDETPVSMTRSRGFVAGVDGYTSGMRSSRGCGRVLCLFNNVDPTAYAPFGASRELPGSMTGILSQFVCVRSIHAIKCSTLGKIELLLGHRLVVEV